MKIDGSKVSLVSLDSCDLQKLWELIYRDPKPEWKKWDAPYYPFEQISFEQFCLDTEKIRTSKCHRDHA